MAENYPNRSKTLWVNCSLRAISPFPTVFLKGLFPRGVKGVIVWEWVKEHFCELGIRSH